MDGPDAELPYCRLCYGDDNEPGNPLFEACACTGGARLIHLKCLEEWIEKRPSRNQTEVSTANQINRDGAE